MYYQHIRQWVMSTVTALIYALLLRLVTAVELQGFYFHHVEGKMGRERKGEKNNSGNRGFSTSSLTKSHHFRRLTSACDKCSTSSSLPISLELETPEASVACKIKNDHLIHSSTKYISVERRKVGGRERDREGGSQWHTTTLHCSEFSSINYY